jgi:3-oxoacyl-[acyl-carrier-protein] synthase II
MVTSLGANKNACFAAFCEGRTGNAPLGAFAPQLFNTTTAYEIQDRTSGDQPGRATKWLCASVQEAIRESGLTRENAGRVAVLIGTGLRELRSLELWWADGTAFDVEQLHFADAIRQSTGWPAPVFTLSNACSASNFALGLGADLLALDEVDTVIVGGVDSITESMFGLLDRVNPLHPTMVQPFDHNRRGVLMGEGAAAVVLESGERARDRGARAQAYVRGVGMTCDASHVTAPDSSGIVRAIRDAHARAGITPKEVELLLVHGTGTALNDESEANAIRDIFGTDAPSVLVTALKSLIGHTSGASALVAVVTAIECMKQRRVPPTINVETVIPAASGFTFVLGDCKAATPRIAQVNAFGFGGVNGVVILEGAAA